MYSDGMIFFSLSYSSRYTISRLEFNIHMNEVSKLDTTICAKGTINLCEMCAGAIGSWLNENKILY